MQAISASYGSINQSYGSVVFALRIYQIRTTFLLDFRFTEWFQSYCNIGRQLTSDES